MLVVFDPKLEVLLLPEVRKLYAEAIFTFIGGGLTSSGSYYSKPFICSFFLVFIFYFLYFMFLCSRDDSFLFWVFLMFGSVKQYIIMTKLTSFSSLL